VTTILSILIKSIVKEHGMNAKALYELGKKLGIVSKDEKLV
jgi:hypothetical protein